MPLTARHAAPVSLAARLGEFLHAELGSRPGRLRAALRIVVPSLVGVVLIMLFQEPHGGWTVLTIFTVSQADAGASLQRGWQRLLGTLAGGIAGLLVIIALIDMPYFFVPALGVAVVVGVYLSKVMAAPYPPLLGTMTFVLVTLTHVEFPEAHVDVALWRIVAIGLGVVVSKPLMVRFQRPRCERYCVSRSTCVESKPRPNFLEPA
jgi:uncharacterized membrane protein YccC